MYMQNITTMVQNAARNILQNEQMAGRVVPQEANEVFNVFVSGGWANKVAINVYNMCQQNNNWNVDQNYITSTVASVLPQLLNGLRARYQQQPMMQQQMGFANPPMTPFAQQPISGASAFQAQPQNHSHSAASIYNRGNVDTGYVPPEQQTPTVPQPRTTYAQPVQGTIQTTNPANEVFNTEAPSKSTYDAIVDRSKRYSNEVISNGLDLTTKAIDLNPNSSAMAIVEAMEDNKSGIRVTNFYNVLSDTIASIDSASIQLDKPFTNHHDPQQVALNFLKEVPALSQNPYYAHTVRYYTMYDIPYAFSDVKSDLDKLKAHGVNKPADMKWNIFIEFVNKTPRLKEVMREYVSYLTQVTKCAFTCIHPETNRPHAVVADMLADIPMMLNKDGKYKHLVATERLYINACMYMMHVFKFIVPDKLYLSPEDPEDLKILINRPDSGLIYRGQMLRYSDEVYEDEEIAAGDDNSVIVTKIAPQVVTMLSSKSTTMLRKHLALVTNIPLSPSTLDGIANNHYNRVMIKEPTTLLECIIQKSPTPIYMETNGLKLMAGKNIDGGITIVPV